MREYFPTRSLQEYARWKVRIDPVYAAALEHLRGHHEPVLDVGCGVGLLAFYLREHGYDGPLLGIDYDPKKIAVAQQVAKHYRDIEFRLFDAREPMPAGHNVVLLDTLQYVDTASQNIILANAARAVPQGGVAILRQGIADGSWRHRFTAFVDQAGRAIRWHKGESLIYPTREQLTRAFAGFEMHALPMWGRTPYNNYLFVFRRR
ncbi:MAG: class I SAM-dependent methyltransferase [Thermoanaerobaculia bacterium]